MVINVDTLRFTRIYCAVYGNEKVFPAHIAQYRLQFACKPHFYLFFCIIAFNISDDTIKR